MNPIYLTFDDGPDPETTPQVLEILKNKNAKATFFVVTDKAKQHPGIISEMLSQGHAVGDHSLDHGYRHFFSKRSRLKKWIETSHQELEKLTGIKPVGFRPPAGVWTPPLASVVKELQIPLIYWDVRFYDAIFQWTPKKVLKSLKRLKPGSVVLLHDKQPLKHRKVFLETLESYLESLTPLGYVPLPMLR